MDKTDTPGWPLSGVPYAGQVSDANQSEDQTTPRPGASPGRRLARDLALYTLARLVLVAVLTVVIMVGARLVGVEVPLLVGVLFAIVIAMPLSLTLFKSLRVRVNSDIAAVDERRRRDKAQLRARLRGDTTEELSRTDDADAGDETRPPAEGKTRPEGSGSGGPE